MLALLVGAGLLTGSQAWALGTPPPRGARHFGAWALSTLGLTAIGLAVFTAWPRKPPMSESVQAILVLAGITAAVALWVGSRIGKNMPQEDRTARQRAFALFWPHMAVLLVLGPLDALIVLLFLPWGGH
jgi:hypothetical protein